MFWDNYVKLCNSVNKAPNVVASEIGIKSSGTVTGWSYGALPRHGTAIKLADYFGITVEELMNDTSAKPGSGGEKQAPRITAKTIIKGSGRHNISADAAEVAFAYDDASPELQAAVRRVLGLEVDIPIAARGGKVVKKPSPSNAETLDRLSEATREAADQENDQY